MLLAGLDLSSKQIDVALIPLDDTADLPPVTFRTAQIQAGLSTADRIRDAAHAARSLLGDVDGYDVSSVWIEEPFGAYRTADRVLLPIMGAIAAAVPLRMAVAVIAVQEWRRTLGLPGNLSKPAAVTKATEWILHHGTLERVDRFPMISATAPTEHQAEALLIAVAGRHLCWKASAVA